jgi:hypothetical protein
MVADANLIAMFTQRYGAFIDPLPEEDSIASFATWVPPQSRLGNQYNFPLQGSLEHGQTADISGNAYTLNASVPMTLVNAIIDGFDFAMTADIPYSDMLRARNGVSQGGGGAAASYFKPLDLKVKGLMRSSTLYRELFLLYGPGTAATITSDIGQLRASSFLVSGGPNYNNTPLLAFTGASWIPGMWTLMKNAKLEVLNSAGTALIGSPNYVVVDSVPDPSVGQVLLSSSSTNSAAVAASHRFLPFGWYQKCCVGLQGILNNTGSLFNISAASYSFWKAVPFAVGGALSRAKIFNVCSRLFPNGLDQGATMFVSSAAFADLAEETVSIGTGATQSAVQMYTGNGEQATKRVGTNKLIYISPVGDIEVRLHKFMKQGIAMLFGNGLVKRGGAADVTFRGDGNQYFLQELNQQAGYQIRCVSNQAVFIETPMQCAIFTGIQSTSDISAGLT